jgi:outer membrane cobalamin receptor
VTVPTATVYLDGAKYGDTQSLKLINGEHVSRVQYLNGSEATTRYGTDHVGGAILITTK